MPDPSGKSSPPPGKGLLGWLGRQIGYVTHAIKHDPELVAKESKVEEKTIAERPDLVFRRTTTDEVRRVSTHMPAHGMRSSTTNETSGKFATEID